MQQRTNAGSPAIEKEPIVIGKIIEEELRRTGHTASWLGERINCDRRNVYDIFRRQHIDTDLLYRISIAMNVDFFHIYSLALSNAAG